MSMQDPRVRLAPQLPSSGAHQLLEALDGVRPIVQLQDDADRWTAGAAASLVSILVRLFPHTTVEGNPDIVGGPWAAGKLSDVRAKVNASIPTATRNPQRDFRISFSASPAAELFIGGDDWTMSLATSPQSSKGDQLGLGLQAAAIFAAAEVLKQALAPLGLMTVSCTPSLTWNLLNYQLAPAPVLALPTVRRVDLAAFGAGSVGSSFVGLMTGLPTVTGTAVVVDKDAFDPTRNPYRYPASCGTESGSKAVWLSSLLSGAGWSAAAFHGSVAEWVLGRDHPGFDGIALSSVDRVEGRLEVADVLARTTLSVGVGGLALHLQREILGDGQACPYCDFVDVGPTIGQVERFNQLTGLPVDRIAKLLLDETLSDEDVRTAVNSGKVHPERAAELVGRRFDDLVGRVYAEAALPTAGSGAAASVTAPFVSWMGGLLMTAEVAKAAYGLPMIDRRIDLDLTGVPTGFTFNRPAISARCVCASPVRQSWMRRLYDAAT